MQTNKVQLFFETETGGTTSIMVNNSKDGLTLSQIQSIANDIITQNVFFTPSGDLKEFKYAQYVITTTTLIE